MRPAKTPGPVLDIHGTGRSRPDEFRYRLKIAWLVMIAPVLVLGAPGQDGGGSSKIEVEIKGYDRKVLLFVPSGYTSKRSWGLVLGMHGGAGNGKSFASRCPVAKITASGYFFASPTSLLGAWGGNGREPHLNRDMAYVRAILETLLRSYNIHPDRIHTMGFSRGSAFLGMGIAFRDVWKGLPVRSFCGHAGGVEGGGKANAYRAKKTAVWILVGEADGRHQDGTRDLFKALQAAGYDARFEIVKGKGHVFPLVPFDQMIRWWRDLDRGAPDLDKPLAAFHKGRDLLGRERWGEAWNAFRRAEGILGEKSPWLRQAIRDELARIRTQAEERLRRVASLEETRPREAKRILKDMIRKFQGTPFEESAREHLARLNER